jgi:hypothetical protein
LLIKNNNEQNGFQFYSTSIAIQQKSNEDSFGFYLPVMIELYFTIIDIGISISLGIIPGIFFWAGVFCFTFVLDFVSFIFSPDMDDFSCGCFLFSCFFFLLIFCFYICYSVLKMNLHCFSADQLKLSHHSNISRHEYRNKMVHGNQWATNTEISVAIRIVQSNINIWLQGRDVHNNICFTQFYFFSRCE